MEDGTMNVTDETFRNVRNYYQALLGDAAVVVRSGRNEMRISNALRKFNRDGNRGALFGTLTQAGLPVDTSLWCVAHPKDVVVISC
jgi:hypothetical protein